jgi:hypothetical protein
MKFRKINQLNINELLDKIKVSKSFASMIKSINASGTVLLMIDELVAESFKEKSLLEKLYSIKNGIIKYPVCIVCGLDAKLISMGWSNYCNGTCGYTDRWANIDSSELISISEKISKKYHSKSKIEKDTIKDNRQSTMNTKYGVDHNFKIPAVIENRKQTWLNIYGYENPNLSDTIKQKIIKTNNERYGHNSPLQNDDILKKSKETLYKNYGVDHNMKSDVTKKTFRKTCNERYGEDHYMQNAKEFDRITKLCFKRKTIKLGDVTHFTQGYENFAIEYLISLGISVDSFITNTRCIHDITGPIYWFSDINKRHRYYPDFYVSETDTLYEVKSNYTYNKAIADGSLLLKINACKSMNLNIKVLIFDKHKKLIKEI